MSENGILHPPCQRLFDPPEPPGVDYPVRVVRIHWDLLIYKRPVVMQTTDFRQGYLLQPEVLNLLNAQKNATDRLIMDLLWGTGGRVSEILALTPSSFVQDSSGFGVVLKTMRKGRGRPTKRSLHRSPKRYIPIEDPLLEDRVKTYLSSGQFKRNERLFKMSRQTVNRHINDLVIRQGRAPFPVSASTFRHSFAVHLLLHGLPLKYVSQLLGHRTVDSTEVYTNVFTTDGGNYLKGVDFH